MSKTSNAPSQKRSSKQEATFNSINEGEPIAVQSKHIGDGTNGQTRAEIDINLTNAPAPGRRFSADAFSINVRDEMFHLMFLQRRANGKDVRAMVDIQMTSSAARLLGDSLVLNPHRYVPASAFQVLQEPDQTVTLSANFARATSSPGGCCIDFYWASPYSVQAVNASSKIYALGEVRIQTSPQVYEGFMKELVNITKHAASSEKYTPSTGVNL